jgi:hypothetical protein
VLEALTPGEGGAGPGGGHDPGLTVLPHLVFTYQVVDHFLG